jgi:hypothetical protein
LSGWPIRSFHAFNHSLHVTWLFPFYHPELSSARGAGRNKVQFLMRRQHQVVALAAPGYMVAESASVGSLTVSPLDRYIFVKSGHSLPPWQCILCQPAGESQENLRNDRNSGKELSGRLPAKAAVVCCTQLSVPPSAFSAAPLLRGEFVFCVLRSASSVLISGAFCTVGPFPESLQTTKFRRLEPISGLNSARRLKGFPHENHF